MESSQNDVFSRLSAAIEDWNAELADSHVRLSEQIRAAQGHLDRLLTPADSQTQQGPSRQELEAEAQSLRQQLEEAREALTEKGDLIAPFEKQFDRAQLDLDESRRELDSALREIEAFRKKEEGWAAFETELAQVSEQSARMAGELESLRGLPERLERAEGERDEARQLLEAARRVVPEETESPIAPASAEVPISEDDAFNEHGHKKRMGEILVGAGVITHGQLTEVLDEQADAPHRRFGDIVVERGFTSDGVIARILAAQLRLPFVEINDDTIDVGSAKLISPQLAELRKCVPLRVEDGGLVVAMANPMDLIAIEDIELATGYRVDPVVATRANIDFTIARYCYRPPES